MTSEPMSDERLAEIRAHFDVLDNLTLDEDDPNADQRIGTYIYYKQDHYHEVLDAVMAREDDGADLLADNDRLRAELAEGREREAALVNLARVARENHERRLAEALEIVRAVASMNGVICTCLYAHSPHCLIDQARALLARANDTPAEGGAGC